MNDTTNGPDNAAARDAISARRHARSKETRRSVVWGERIAGGVITVGGLMVILAVLGIMVFLIRVVAPLMGSGSEVGQVHFQLDTEQDVIWVNGDEFQTLGSVVAAEGRIITFHVPTGAEISRDAFDFDGAVVTAVNGTLDRDDVAFGFDDGTVRFATVGFESASTPRRGLPADARELDARDLIEGRRVFTEVGTGDYRTLGAVNELGEAERISDHPIVAIDYRVGGTRERPTLAFATVDAANQGRVSRSRIRRNMMTGEETVTTTTVELPSMDIEDDASVTGILLSGGADRAIISTDDGLVYRFDLRDFDNPVLAERRRVADEDVAVTAMSYLGGEQSLVVGGSDGSLSVFFQIQSVLMGDPADGDQPLFHAVEGEAGPEIAAQPLREEDGTADGYELVRAREHTPMPAAIQDITEARRDKSFVATDVDGNVWVHHSTSDQVLFEFQRQGDISVPAIGMVFPRSDGAMLVSQRGDLEAWQYRNDHPEITLGTLFGRIWYEGYSQPDWVWQSTAGTDLAEPKYSLVPLVFGTIKAAFYAMLFATPIALMAAIYTSEFVHRRVRSTVKPMMEMMESLPTVVLGFIAALVLAPIVEEWIAAVLLGFIAVPLGLMLGAFGWQMLPTAAVRRLDGVPKFTLMGTAIILTTWLAYLIGPSFESALFYGDFKAWTAGRIGTGSPFMFLILLPVSYLAVAWGFRRTLGHGYRDRLRALPRAAAGRLDALRWVAFLIAAVALSWSVAVLLTALGYDPRGGVIDSYQQRNALVVGMIMAFAVIPNIYTLAEDALNAVPGHLRAGSLATGATPWQTAVWIVLPTAASGVFSAVMMGMGRAVGETMIVVMAAGNTPILEWNIFSGLRTLSANIAIELPEAVKDGTNYRVLFLAALTLFIMTFVINTIAELIRQRFRKRAFQL